MRVIATTLRYLRIHHKTAKLQQDQPAFNRNRLKAEKLIEKSQSSLSASK